jgi:hypothetical protein
MTTHITKTWFDGERVVTQEIPESEVYKQQPVAWGVFEGNLHDMFFSQVEAERMACLKGAHAEVRPLYAFPPAQPMHPEIKKMYEDYFDRWFRESSAAVPENFMDALMFDAAVRDVDAMIAIARADERESCAKVCDHMASRCNDIRAAALESAAENIRVRGETK